MAIHNSCSDEQQPPAISKKPYDKPSFRYERVFVTSALTCSKAGGESTCKILNVPKVS
jgi:hypothetical protein